MSLPALPFLYILPARPGIGLHGMDGVAADGMDLTTIESGKMAEKRHDIPGPLPEGRNVYIDDIQPVVEVAAKLLVGDGLHEVNVSGGDNADVHRLGHLAANPGDLLILQETEYGLLGL